MKFVANYNIWLKCYIIFCYIVADGKRRLQYLARAINNLNLFLEKNIVATYSFLISTIISPSSVFTTHTILSSLCSSSIPTISAGIVVLNDFEFGFCKIIFDLTSNNFIHSLLSFFINIFDNELYIFYLYLIEL